MSKQTSEEMAEILRRIAKADRATAEADERRAAVNRLAEQ